MCDRLCDKVVCDKLYVKELCMKGLCVKDCVCDKVVGTQNCVRKIVCNRVVCERVVVDAEEAAAGRRRTTGYRTKNKNPTERCGKQRPAHFPAKKTDTKRNPNTSRTGTMNLNNKTTKPVNDTIQPLQAGYPAISQTQPRSFPSPKKQQNKSKTSQHQTGQTSLHRPW